MNPKAAPVNLPMGKQIIIHIILWMFKKDLKQKIPTISRGILLILLGILLLMNLDFSLRVLLQILAIYIIFAGAVDLVGYRKEPKGEFKNVVLSFLKIVSGVLALILPTFAVVKFAYVIGVLLVYYGISNIIISNKTSASGSPLTYILIAAGVAMIATGGNFLIWILIVTSILSGVIMLFYSAKEN